MTAKKKIEEADTDGGANLGQVRELLFGNQVRDFEKRFSKMELRLDKEIEKTKTDLKKRIESLDLFVRQEAESLSQAIHAEQSERTQAIKDAATELSKAATALEKKIARLDERLTKSDRTLNNLVLDQVTSVRDDLAQKAAELEALVDQEASDLRDAKTDRAMLGNLLQEMALRITDSLELPDLE